MIVAIQVEGILHRGNCLGSLVASSLVTKLATLFMVALPNALSCLCAKKTLLEMESTEQCGMSETEISYFD